MVHSNARPNLVVVRPLVGQASQSRVARGQWGDAASHHFPVVAANSGVVNFRAVIEPVFTLAVTGSKPG